MNTATQTRQQSLQVDQRQQSTAVAAIQPSRMPIPAAVAKEFDIAPAEWRVLVEQIFPAAKSIEAVMMALAYCRKRNLDIFKKPVHIVPMWSSSKKEMVETVWPGIAEIRTTASRTGDYAGIDEVEFGPMIDGTFEGLVEQWENRKVTNKVTKIVRYPEWAKVTVYRMNRGIRCAYTARVFWEETYATVGKTDLPNDMWGKRPRGQLDKCVEAAALRKAFPEELGNTYAAEEMEGREISEGVTIDHAAKPKPPVPPAPPAPPAEVIDLKAQTAPVIEAEPVGTRHDVIDPSEFLDELETALAGANDEATVEEVWTALDPEGTFDGDEDGMLDVAYKIKARRLAQIGAVEG